MDGGRDVQIREQEIPGGLNQLAREVGVEVVKDHSFSRMSGVANIGIVQGLDVIFPSAVRSRGMKEAGVLVPMEGDLEREALAPIGQLVPEDSLEGRPAEVASVRKESSELWSWRHSSKRAQALIKARRSSSC